MNEVPELRKQVPDISVAPQFQPPSSDGAVYPQSEPLIRYLNGLERRERHLFLQMWLPVARWLQLWKQKEVLPR